MDKVPLLDCAIQHHTTRDFEEASLTMQWITGIQTARLWLWTPKWPMNWLQLLLAVVQEP